jgi:hypothetical protein
MLVSGVYNGHNMSGFIIHVNSSTPSPYEALFLVGATNLNQGLNIEGIFIDNSAGTQTQVPLKYDGSELCNKEYTDSTCAGVLTQAKQYTNSLILLPNYNSKSTLTIQPNSSLTPTTSCFVC